MEVSLLGSAETEIGELGYEKGYYKPLAKSVSNRTGNHEHLAEGAASDRGAGGTR